MDRCERVSAVVARSLKLVSKRKEDSMWRSTERDDLYADIDALRDQLREAVAALCSSPDYTDHLRLPLPRDFAFLASEIIHDIIETAAEKYANKWELRNLAMIEGSWAEFGKLAMANANLRNGRIHENTDFETLRAESPTFYEELDCSFVPDKLCKVLKTMGTRFSCIWWKEGAAGRSNRASSEIEQFLKRQLRSKYLRTLNLDSSIETRSLHNLFVDFVRRPQFEKLHLYNGSPIPFEVFEAAHKAWKAPNLFQVRHKLINANIAEETIEKFEKYFKINVKFVDNYHAFCSKHPVHSTAQMKLELIAHSSREWICVRMTLGGFEPECEEEGSLTVRMTEVSEEASAESHKPMEPADRLKSRQSRKKRGSEDVLVSISLQNDSKRNRYHASPVKERQSDQVRQRRSHDNSRSRLNDRRHVRHEETPRDCRYRHQRNYQDYRPTRNSRRERSQRS